MALTPRFSVFPFLMDLLRLKFLLTLRFYLFTYQYK
jgi:hypothetical protein